MGAAISKNIIKCRQGGAAVDARTRTPCNLCRSMVPVPTASNFQSLQYQLAIQRNEGAAVLLVVKESRGEPCRDGLEGVDIFS